MKSKINRHLINMTHSLEKPAWGVWLIFVCVHGVLVWVLVWVHWGFLRYCVSLFYCKMSCKFTILDIFEIQNKEARE